MHFNSILFPILNDEAPICESFTEPACFKDLNLNQIIKSITEADHLEHLLPFFYTPLQDLITIAYRHEVFQDIENNVVYTILKDFSSEMTKMYQMTEKMTKFHYSYQKKRLFLDVVDQYTKTLLDLSTKLGSVQITSNGMSSFRQYLIQYVTSDEFISLKDQAQSLQFSLSNIQYCLEFDGPSIHVHRYENEPNYANTIDKVFNKFKENPVNTHLSEYSFYPEMNHVEASILNFVAQLYPEIFAELDIFYENNQSYCCKTISKFHKEIQFYLAYIQYIIPLKETGLPFCYPTLSTEKNSIFATSCFDLALANKLVKEHLSVVCNDFQLQGSERILIVTGANQGGKTTFARCFGQLHYLSQLGCPVPGTAVKLFLFDHIFTHFEQEESLTSLNGKLQNDLLGISQSIQKASAKSVFILNEIFSSTTLKDAYWLGSKILEKILQLNAFAVYVTFVDELSTLNEQTVSFVSTVEPDNPLVRTYKVVRKPADGLSYALAIAEKHHLTYHQIKERIKNATPTII